nr:hypothetical protein Iba_chr11dCG4240 [Ipomoea batatas]
MLTSHQSPPRTDNRSCCGSHAARNCFPEAAMLGSDLLAEGIVAAALFTTRRSRLTPSCGDGGEKTRQQLLPAAKQQSPLGLEPPSLSSTSSDGGRRRRDSRNTIAGINIYRPQSHESAGIVIGSNSDRDLAFAISSDQFPLCSNSRRNLLESQHIPPESQDRADILVLLVN